MIAPLREGLVWNTLQEYCAKVRMVVLEREGAEKMQIGMIGLGRMGANMVQRLQYGGHQCVVFDRNQDNVRDSAKEGATGAASLEDFVAKLKPPRVRRDDHRPCGSGKTAATMNGDAS